MKQYEIIKAFNSTEKLAENKDLPATIKWSIYQLRQLLRPHVEFQIEQEELLKEKYRPFANENGVLSSTDKAAEFLKEMQELNQLDKDISFEKFKVVLSDSVDIDINAMEALDKFIEFTLE